MALGVALGGAGVYTAIEKPWADSSEKVAEVAVDAGASVDSNKKGKHRGKRRKRQGERAGKEVGLQVIDERVQLTAADRKMIWKGPAVSLPERNLDMSNGGGGRSLEQGEIGDGVSRGQNAVMRCIADARGQAELAATITLKFLVNGDGGI